MEGIRWLVLAGLLITTVMTVGCEQQDEKPRLDTTSHQAFIESLEQVRSQVDETHIKQFDQTIYRSQASYQLQKQYSLLPASNPLNRLTAEQVLQLTSENHKQPPRRLRNWTSL